MLQVGDRAPSFKLPADGGRQFGSAALRGKRYLLYFYPRDDTPGCTRQACAFREALPALEKLDVPVFGVSGDSVAAHDRFVKKYALNFPLLSDPDHKLIEAYGVWVEKNLYGRKSFGIQRSSFLIDTAGRIAMAWPKVSPDKHVAEVMEHLAGKSTG